MDTVSKADTDPAVEEAHRIFEGVQVQLVRRMTPTEMEKEGWSGEREVPMALIMSNGIVLYPSRDPEGNGPGCMFGYEVHQNGSVNTYRF